MGMAEPVEGERKLGYMRRLCGINEKKVHSPYGPHGFEVFTEEELKKFFDEHSNKDYRSKLAEVVCAIYDKRIDGTIDKPPFLLEFGELHHMNIIDLGKQLLDARRKIINSAPRKVREEDRKHVSDLLHEYSRAILDNERMLARRPYRATTESPVGLLLNFLLAGDRSTINGEPARQFQGWLTLQERTRIQEKDAETKWTALLRRLGMAVFGGILLIVPVVIMAFDASRTKCLVTLSGAVMIFAVALALLAKESSEQEILGATAAYAAVLAVFLGISVVSPVGA